LRAQPLPQLGRIWRKTCNRADFAFNLNDTVDRPQMNPPRKPPTMADVAKATGVSPMTVSRAFKRDSSVSLATREMILKAAEGLGYVFDATASTLRSQKTNFVAVTIPSINNANFAETVGGISDGLKERGLQILLGNTGYDIAEEERMIEQLLRRRPEAIVVTGGKHTERSRRLLANAGIPVIETWDLPTEPIEHVVGFSNAEAVRGMVDHFVAQGYRKIAFIGGDADRDTRGTDRRLGFIAAMQAHGLDADRLIAAGMPPISMREGADAMAHLLAELPDTEAVICVSDLSAFGALTECQRRGVAVPARIAIAGFGDYEIGGISVPSLTTINPHPRQIGTRTAALILDVLDGVQTTAASVSLPPVLVLRESSR
jgi:LacI family gluconate utilization system Gnt-I transcriptional repressor